MNKKSILGLLAVLMIAAVAAFNVNLNSQKETLSDLAMENVEALANCESGSGYIRCTVYPVPVVCFWHRGMAMPSGYSY